MTNRFEFISGILTPHPSPPVKPQIRQTDRRREQEQSQFRRASPPSVPRAKALSRHAPACR